LPRAAIFPAARGLADRERRQKVGMQTNFRISSMNKMFTAVVVLQLREQGKLSLDDTLAKWLPDYPNAELAKSVTLHHLLTHTGGTGDIFGPLFGQHRRELTSHQAYIDLYGQRGLELTPGARFAHSTYGFVLLGRVIEKASGESYDDHEREHVYAPARMTATGSELGVSFMARGSMRTVPFIRSCVDSSESSLWLCSASAKRRRSSAVE
jgi:D-alanyl-D-alanine carboxypeptidase